MTPANFFSEPMTIGEGVALDLRGPVDRWLGDPERPRKKVRGKRRKVRRRLREARGFCVMAAASKTKESGQ